MKKPVVNISNWSPAKRELFARALAASKNQPSPRDTIARRIISGPVALSFAQERLWFLAQLEPGSAAYNVPGAVGIEGELDQAALERSLSEILRRHEVLRTRFEMVEGRPVQVVEKTWETKIEVVDFGGLDSQEQEKRARQLARAEADKPFDLKMGPLLRVKLIRLTEKNHVLLYTMHHIVCDGWSSGVMVREFGQLYEAIRQGKPSPLAEPAIQYADYAVWQRQWLQGEVLEKQLHYWREQLKGAPAVLNLPTDRPRPAVQTYAGGAQEVKLGREVTQKLEAFSRQEGLTLFMVLLGSFKILLSRYSGQEDIVVGSPIANRNRKEVEGLIGFFANTLVLRTDLSGDPTFVELMKREKEVALGAYENQDVPFEKLVQELKVERRLSDNPLFQVMFVLLNTPQENLNLGGLRLRSLESGIRAPFDLTLTLEETDEGISGLLTYNTDLFDAAKMALMAGHWKRLLGEAVGHPEKRLSELEMLSAGESQQLLVQWNETKKEYPQNKYIHRLFEEQAKATPGATAVVFGGQSLTYRELAAKSNQLAQVLRKAGVGPEVLVGICVERSLDMVVGLLGVLKAGGAYVPLDPQYPKERLGFIMEDARLKVLLTQERLLGLLPGYSGETICLDRDVGTFESEAPTDGVGNVQEENAAYVIYTSGSTGQPKGVVITHGNASNFVHWGRDCFSGDELAGVLASTSICFDLSIFELFVPWSVGGKVILAENALAWGQGKKDEGVSLVNTVPSVIRELLSMGKLSETVRTINLAGEALSSELVKQIYDHSPWVTVNDLYGPSETTTYSTYGLRSKEGAASIGRPIANTQVYLVDRMLQPVPLGVTGELCISGEGVARGYVNRGDITAEKFVPDPFGKTPGQRMYRTGDLCKYSPDGSIQFVGRKDQQVKLRGFRIELGEIEARLSEHVAVRDCAVLVREDEPGQKQLVGYVVLKEGSTATSHEFREHLKARLPEHMLPALFVIVDALPLTPNGKVDRQSLPKPGNAEKEESSYVAPRNEAEKILAEIFQQVLRAKRVGVEDNFFELGGDSILSIQIVARVNEAGLTLKPRDLFEHQTVAGLARVAARMAPVEAEQGMVSGEVPLTPIQRWFFEQQIEPVGHFNQAVMLEVRDLEVDVVKEVIMGILEHHDALRMRYSRASGDWTQNNDGRSDDEIFGIIDLTEVETGQQKNRLAIEAQKVQESLDLEKGPVVRVVWFEMGAQQSSRVLMVIHHLVVDGVSWRILMDDLQRGCVQLKNGGLEFPRKTTSYQQWAQKLESYAGTKQLQQELQYWREIGPAERLPTDYEINENLVEETAAVTVWLSEAQTRSLLQEVSARYNTEINDVLLTALAESFCQWTKGKKLVLDLEGHGREQELVGGVDVTRTVGWFTTLYPVALEWNPKQGVGEALKSVKEQLRGVPGRGLGYGLLKYVKRCDELKKNGGAQVSFNYLGQLDQVLETGGWFRRALENSGNAQSGKGRRAHLLEVSSSVRGGRLEITFLYNQKIHKRETLEMLAESYLQSLRRMIEHCAGQETRGYTPSDFPLAGLTQDELNSLLQDQLDLQKE